MKKFTFLLAALAISLVTFAQGTITYNLNGGVTNDYGWKSINDVYVDMNADWNAYSGTTKTWKPLADIDPANSTTGFATSVGGGDEAKFNEFMKKAYEDGSMMECAKKYGVQESIVEQK